MEPTNSEDFRKRILIIGDGDSPALARLLSHAFCADLHFDLATVDMLRHQPDYLLEVATDLVEVHQNFSLASARLAEDLRDLGRQIDLGRMAANNYSLEQSIREERKESMYGKPGRNQARNRIICKPQYCQPRNR